MKLVKVAWKFLVGLKDLMVLAFMVLFFIGLFAALSARPNPGAIRPGALLLKLNGPIVEQPADPAPGLAALTQPQPHQFRVRDLVRAIDAARDDARVKVVVLDLDSFGGGYPAGLTEVAGALARVRAAHKPVLAYATMYTDSAYRLASAASEVWVHPMGGALFLGPGGQRLYYKGLIDKLGVNAHVYRVGKYKSYVEPYTRADASPEAKEEDQALYGAVLADWQAQVTRNRPQAHVADWLTRPDALVTGAHGDIAAANLSTGLVDKLGDRLAFGRRVAEIVGKPDDKPEGSFATIKLDDWVALHPLSTHGDAIGVLTVAGDIVDGKAGRGSAGGDTISRLVLDGLRKDKLKALVVRVDSPGGSAMASEQIRQAILQAKAHKLPVVVSMGSVAASGGYWVSTAGDMIFAQPNTITGSIGIFGIIPSFENSLKKIGVTSDGVRTTPLSGQPDITGGFTPAVDAVLQSGIEQGYARFIERVSQARHMAPDRVNEIAQGRVWIGTSAKQIGLIDRYGNLQDAINEAARRAGLKPDDVHAEYLEKKPSAFATLLASWNRKDDDDQSASGGDAFARIAAERRGIFAQALGDIQRIASGGSVQARCLECASVGGPAPSASDTRLLDLVLARFGG